MWDSKGCTKRSAKDLDSFPSTHIVQFYESALKTNKNLEKHSVNEFKQGCKVFFSRLFQRDFSTSDSMRAILDMRWGNNGPRKAPQRIALQYRLCMGDWQTVVQACFWFVWLKNVFHIYKVLNITRQNVLETIHGLQGPKYS